MNLLPNVPLVESPFFDEIFTPDRFDSYTIEVARALHRDGFAVIDFPDTIDDLAERIKTALHPVFDWDAYHRGKPDGLRVQDAWKTNPDVKRIATNERLLTLLSSLYGRKAIPFQTLNFPVGTQQAFHTDCVHFSSRPERFMCGVWVALEDVDASNGPLEYYPGSHRLPIYTNEHIGQNPPAGNPHGNYTHYLKLWPELVRVHGFKREEFHPRKGQALIWSSNLFHGGARQLDKAKTRWSQVTHYYFENCAYYTPLTEAPLKDHALRNIVNIETGLPVNNILNGEVIQQVPAAGTSQSLLGRLKRWRS
jgi:ectoine hydroxylase-related dioxygenase (phytanoyl-CoA dioxygenase family)